MTSNPIVFAEETVYIATPCPEWCTKRPLHPCTEHYDAVDISRYHVGPEWGMFKAYGEEFTHSPNVLKTTVSLELPDDVLIDQTAADLRQLAADAIAAAEWLEARA